MENLGLWASKCFLLSSSLTSFDLALPMSGLDPFIFSMMHVIERTVGGKAPSLLHPTFTHRFSPYSQFASSSSVSNKSTASFHSHLNTVQASSHPSIPSHSIINSRSFQVPTISTSSLSKPLQPSISSHHHPVNPYLQHLPKLVPSWLRHPRLVTPLLTIPFALESLQLITSSDGTPHLAFGHSAQRTTG